MVSPRALRFGGGILVALLWLHFFTTLPDVYRVRTNDFPAYWAAGRMVLEGAPEQIYSTQWKWYTNLPVVSLLLVPLAALEYETAWHVLWWSSVASFVLVFVLLLYALARYFPPLDVTRVVLVTLIFVSFAPVMRRCLSLGQTTPLMVLLFAIVYLLARAGRDRWAGLVLGFICVIKIPPLLLLPLLAARKRLPMAGVAAVVVAAAVLASWAFFGEVAMQQYAERVILDNFGRAHAAFNNQSLDGAFMRVLSQRGLSDWVPVARPAEVRVAVYGVFLVLALALLASARSLLWPARRPDDTDARSGSLELEMGLGVALMVLVFPIVWIHYYLFLLVPLGLLPFWWQQRELSLSARRRALVMALFVAGVLLVGGQEAHENAWYVARESDELLRWRLNAQPLGALLLVAAFVPVLGEIARRQKPQEDSSS